MRARPVQRGRRSKSSVFAHARNRRIFLRRDEVHIVQLELQVLDRFLNEIAVAVPDMLELRRGNAHEKHALAHIAVARGLEPRVVRLTIDFLFECSQDLDPRIQSNRRGDGERHAQSFSTSVAAAEQTGGRIARMPKVDPVMWKQGACRSRFALAGSRSDLKVAGASVNLFRRREAPKKS